MDPAAGEDWPEALEELMPDLAQEELVGLDEPLSALSSFESQVPWGATTAACSTTMCTIHV